MAHVTKSAKCMSTTGTRPVIAAPIAEPTIAASEIGAFRTRSGPNSSQSPFVTPNGTPSTMSSPMQYTRGSRRISSRSARLSASPKSMTGTSVAPRVRGEEIGQGLVRLGQRARLGVGDRVVDLRHDPVADLLRLGVVQELLLVQQTLEACDWVSAPPFAGLVLRAVRLRIALEVPHPADRVRLDERRPVAAAPPLGGPRDGVPHRQHVVAVDRLARDAVARRARRDRAAGR